jgi:peptide-methionine (S)-S-oxide reductase
MTHNIVLGGGCFWCLDAAFRMVHGVEESVVGYAGGDSPHPTYEHVSSGASGHAEVVRITFDDSLVTLEDILRVFWTIHDPTTRDRQGHDVGTQYRSCIYYEEDEDAPVVDASMQEVQTLWDDPVVTTVEKLEAFYPAEDYHQNYFAKNPEAGYCQVVINPKLLKLREKAAELLSAS